MDTTTFIVLTVAIVAVIIVRIALRHRQRGTRQRDEERRHLDETAQGTGGTAAQRDAQPQEEAPRPSPAVPRVSVTPAQSEPQGEKGETVVVSDVHKSFGGREVVSGVSFRLMAGEVFGLVGPNGAGKTTTIRMLMDIIRPDQGEISLFGRPLDAEAKDRIGYLPEERGLYQKMKVSDSLVFLAGLKSVDARVARERAEELLGHVDMLPHRDKKIKELSRGMGQLIQFLATIAHDPDLIVLDEPFAGLDPVNRQLIKETIIDLKAQGKSIILSTHMMSEVEEMCDRILMIDRGRVVLYGNLAEIKWHYRNNSVLVEADGTIGDIEGIVGRKERGAAVELFLDGDTEPQAILEQLMGRGVRVSRFQVSTPSLNEIFLQVVEQGR